MKISIIVPVYNSEKYLPSCLDSLITQTYKNIEIIVVDDGSTDSSANIINDFALKDSRIKKISQKNEGAFIARNKGIALSTGDYVMFVDSDDWIDINTIDILVNYIKKYNADLIKFNFLLEPSKIKNPVSSLTKNSEIFINSDNKKIVYDMLLDSYRFNNLCNEIIRRELCTTCQINKHLNMGEDFLLNCYIVTNAKNILMIDEALYHYRENPNSSTHKISYQSTILNIKDIFTVYEEKYKFLKLWGYDLDINKNRIGKRLIEFLSAELLKIYKIEPTNYIELDKIYDLIFSNKLFDVLTSGLTKNNFDKKEYLKRKFKLHIIKKEKAKMNMYIRIVKIKKILNNI